MNSLQLAQEWDGAVPQLPYYHIHLRISVQAPYEKIYRLRKS
ncbi:MAG: hypothetical protein AAFV71_30685 [Cyanobacteria bacterium J06633_8]